MTRRTFILFSIFIILAVFLFIFAYFNRQYIARQLEIYKEKLTVCGNILDETQCFAIEKCEGIYGPSCPTCQDLVFRRCDNVPLKAKIEEAKQKELCQNSGGLWQKTKYGRFCVCQINNQPAKFDKKTGCVLK